MIYITYIISEIVQLHCLQLASLANLRNFSFLFTICFCVNVVGAVVVLRRRHGVLRHRHRVKEGNTFLLLYHRPLSIV